MNTPPKTPPKSRPQNEMSTLSRLHDLTTNRTQNTTAMIDESFEQAHFIAMKRSAAAAIAKCEAMHEQLELEKRIASEDRAQLTAELKKNQQRGSAIRAALETELRSEKNKNLELQEKLAEALKNGNSEELEKKLSEVKRELQVANSDLEAERKNTAAISQEQMDSLQRISFLEEELAESQVEAKESKDELNSKCNLLEHQLQDLQAENDSLRQMMKAFREHDEFISFISEGGGNGLDTSVNLEEELLQQRLINAEAKARIETLERSTAELTQQFGVVSQVAEKANDQCAEMEAQCATLGKKMASLKKELGVETDKNTLLETENAKLRANVEHLDRKIEETEAQSKTMQKRVHDYEIENERLAERVLALRSNASTQRDAVAIVEEPTEVGGPLGEGEEGEDKFEIGEEVMDRLTRQTVLLLQAQELSRRNLELNKTLERATEDLLAAQAREYKASERAKQLEEIEKARSDEVEKNVAVLLQKVEEQQRHWLAANEASRGSLEDKMGELQSELDRERKRLLKDNESATVRSVRRLSEVIHAKLHIRNADGESLGTVKGPSTPDSFSSFPNNLSRSIDALPSRIIGRPDIGSMHSASLSFDAASTPISSAPSTVAAPIAPSDRPRSTPGHPFGSPISTRHKLSDASSPTKIQMFIAHSQHRRQTAENIPPDALPYTNNNWAKSGGAVPPPPPPSFHYSNNHYQLPTVESRDPEPSRRIATSYFTRSISDDRFLSDRMNIGRNLNFDYREAPHPREYFSQSSSDYRRPEPPMQLFTLSSTPGLDRYRGVRTSFPPPPPPPTFPNQIPNQYSYPSSAGHAQTQRYGPSVFNV